MREILIVYEEVNLKNEQPTAVETSPAMITVSVDEKPGIQAIKNIAPDLPPLPEKYRRFGRS